MRDVTVKDSVLLREGIGHPLAEGDVEVVAAKSATGGCWPWSATWRLEVPATVPWPARR
jgi:hypothetical protein